MVDATALQNMIADLIAEDQSVAEAIRALEAQRLKLQEAAAGLMKLVGVEPVQAEFDGTLADACRTVLQKSAGKSMSPLEVREGLKALGYDASKHTNLMASIHSVLKRLAESEAGDVKSKDAKDGSGTRYAWVTRDRPTPKPVAAAKPVTFDPQAVFGSYQQMLDTINNSTYLKTAGLIDAALAEANKLTAVFGTSTAADKLRQDYDKLLEVANSVKLPKI